MYDKIAEVIKDHDRFAVTAHIGPEADAIGAQLGMKIILESFGKKAVPVLHDAVPENLKFLPHADTIIQPDKLNPDEIDAWFVVDCGQLNRVGDPIMKMIQQHPCVVNIDHHVGNPEFGHINFIKITASTTVIIYLLAKELGIDITPELATILYSGIIADTDSFKNSNTGPEVVGVAADLLELGADAREITFNLYEKRTPGEAKLLGYSLLNFKLEDRIIWISLPQSVFKETGAFESETERLTEELRATDGVDVALLFKEMPSGRIKVSLRSKSGLDVSEVARKFGGGGHVMAAGCLVPGPLSEIESQVIAAVREAMEASAVRA